MLPASALASMKKVQANSIEKEPRQAAMRRARW